MGGGGVRKKGVRGYIEILYSEFLGLIKLNLLFCVCLLPSAALFLVGLFGYYSEIMLILALIAAFPVGGAVSATMYCITCMLRDEPGFLLHDFVRKLKENIKQAAAPGILCVSFVCAQVYLWGPFLFSRILIDPLWIIPGIGFFLIFAMVTPYFFLQIAYIKLSTVQIFKNSLLLSFANAPRSFMGAFAGGIMWGAYVMLLPGSFTVTPLILIIGFSVSWFLDLIWVWPIVNKQFNIENQLREMKETREREKRLD